jgi:DNA-binding MarR family transcriptional regulator
MATLLGLRRATFTEILLAVKIPKSSLNKNLAILEDHGFVKQSRGFLFAAPGPRKFIEITPEGEEAIKSHLELIRNAAQRLLVPRVGRYPSEDTADDADDGVAQAT